MNEIFKIVLSLSLSGSLLILILFLCKPLFKNKISKRWQYYIWLVVIARLLLPFTPKTSFIGTLFQETNRAIVQTDTPLTSKQNIAFSPQQGDNKAIKKDNTLQSKKTLLPNRIFTNLKQNLWLIWLIVALILLTQKITTYRDFVKYIKIGRTEVSNIKLLDLLAIIGEQVGVKKPVELYINNLISSPLLLGFFRPCIVLPTANLSDTDFQYIILHELMHYRRWDMFYKWLIQLTICLHWFNPLVYRMSREIGRACELACDEAVIKKLDEKGQREYGNTLINAIGIGGDYKDTLASMTLNESKELLKERLEAIMKYRRKSKIVITITLAITVMLSFGTAAIGAYSIPKIVTNNKNNSFETNNNLLEKDRVKMFMQQSYYRNFQTTTNADSYKISGTLYQNENPRGLVRFETLPGVKLTIKGSIELVEGDIKLVYKDSDGTLVILAEGKAEEKTPILIDYKVKTSGKGEFYFEADSAICKFDLEFSKTNKILYYLTNKNPLKLSYK